MRHASAAMSAAACVARLAVYFFVCAGKKETVMVDMAKSFSKLGLDVFFPENTWPPCFAVRELATKLKSLKKDFQVAAPFVAVDLKK